MGEGWEWEDERMGGWEDGRMGSVLHTITVCISGSMDAMIGR